jgi:uncharacterized protein (DUF1810 family)
MRYAFDLERFVVAQAPRRGSMPEAHPSLNGGFSRAREAKAGPG